MVLTDAEEVHSHLLGKNTFFDDVTDRLGVRKRAVIGVVSDIAAGVEAEDERKFRRLALGLAYGI